MTFEEEFPSFKGVAWYHLPAGMYQSPHHVDEGSYQKFFCEPDVRAACLDKQRVREAIRDEVPGMTMDHREDCMCDGCRIFRRLGL